MKKNVLLAALCLLASCVLLLLCSQCSPLYPTNVWVDANCLLTVGRVMKEGGVLYRDIYEQKGPTLYLINMLAACISDTSFLGVYVMEVISFAATLLWLAGLPCGVQACLRRLRMRCWLARACWWVNPFPAATVRRNSVSRC